MSTSDINKTCKDDVCEVNDKLQNMRTADNISLCANCGKERVMTLIIYATNVNK